MNLHPSLMSRALWRSSSRMSLYIAAFILPSILTSLSVPAAGKHPHSMMLPPLCFTVWILARWWAMPGFLQTWCIQAKEFNLCFIRLENLVSHGLRVLQVPFGKLQTGCHVPFTREWLPSGHSTIKAWLVECCKMVVLLEGSPLFTEKRWSSVRVTIGFLVNSLTVMQGL